MCYLRIKGNNWLSTKEINFPLTYKVFTPLIGDRCHAREWRQEWAGAAGRGLLGAHSQVGQRKLHPTGVCLPPPREDRSALLRKRVEGGSCLQTPRSFCSLELSPAEWVRILVRDLYLFYLDSPAFHRKKKKSSPTFPSFSNLLFCHEIHCMHAQSLSQVRLLQPHGL